MGLRNLLYSTFLSGVLAFNGCNKDSPVEPVNHAPVIEQIVASDYEPFTEERVSLECVASDEDDDNLIYDWRCDKGYFDFVDKRTANWYSPENVGVSHITAKVDDGKMGTDSHSLDLRVVSRFDTILVSEDAYVDRLNPNLNTQNSSYTKNGLNLYKDDEGISKEVYLKFNLDVIQMEIKSAKLRLVVKGLMTYPDVELSCDMHMSKGVWNENNLTWVNRPDYDITPIKRFSVPRLLNSSDPKIFYVEGLIDFVKSSMNNPSQNNGLVIKPIEQDIGKILCSKEGAIDTLKVVDYIPALIVEYE